MGIDLNGDKLQLAFFITSGGAIFGFGTGMFSIPVLPEIIDSVE